jgi:hypothetical protein
MVSVTTTHIENGYVGSPPNSLEKKALRVFDPLERLVAFGIIPMCPSQDAQTKFPEEIIKIFYLEL